MTGAQAVGTPADPRGGLGSSCGAEAAGFDLLACGEHLFFHGPTPNAFVALAAAAGATQDQVLCELT